MRGEPARRRSEGLAAAILLHGGPVAAFAVLGICLAAALLVPFGWWHPAAVVPLLPALAVGVAGLARRLPGRPAGIPVWTTVLSVAIAVGFGLWAGLTRSEHLIIRRDAGAYALFAQWLATRHGLPIDVDLGAFGGPAALGVPGFTLASPAFFEVLTGTGGPGRAGATGAAVVPQFLLGAPALYSLGWWPAGWTGLFTVPALIGGFAVLAAAGLAARLIGPAWAPVAAAAVALTQPVLHAARATLSEPPALLLVLAAACLAVDAVTQGGDDGPPRGSARLALAAGAVLGLAGLVRIDVLREVAVALPVCAVLAWRGNRAGLPLAAAALVGAGMAMIPAWLLSRPYLDLIGPSLLPLVVATAGSALCSLTVLGVARRRAGRPATRRAAVSAPGSDRLLPAAAGVVVVVAGLLLAARPSWTTVRQSDTDPAVPLIASLQRQQGLAVDGARTYAERSVEWLVWYTGPIAAAAGLLVVAALAARAVRWWRAADLPPGWLAPLSVALGSVALTLYRPGITPDHPWADRRLVPVALPATMLAATGAAAWLARSAARLAGRPAGAAAAVAGLLIVLVPAARATWPLADRRTEVGQPAAAAAVCEALGPRDAVLAVADADGGIRAQNEWVQVVRGVCRRPSAALTVGEGEPGAAGGSLARLGELVGGAGGRLVLLSAGEDDGRASAALDSLGLAPRRAALLRTTEDQHLLERRPFDVDSLVVDVWLAVWEPPGAG